MPLNFIEPFDLQTLYVNYFLGNANLLPFAFVLVYSFIGAYLNFSNTVYLILLAIGAIMFSVYLGQAIYILVIFIVGFILFKMFSRIFQ